MFVNWFKSSVVEVNKHCYAVCCFNESVCMWVGAPAVGGSQARPDLCDRICV